MDTRYRQFLAAIAAQDARELEAKDREYGASWKKRGGQGAYHVAVRKLDRMDAQLARHHFDVFEALAQDRRAEGLIDDIRDYRRYLMLWEAEMIARGVLPAPPGVRGWDQDAAAAETQGITRTEARGRSAETQGISPAEARRRRLHDEFGFPGGASKLATTTEPVKEPGPGFIRDDLRRMAVEVEQVMRDVGVSLPRDRQGRVTLVSLLGRATQEIFHEQQELNREAGRGEDENTARLERIRHRCLLAVVYIVRILVAYDLLPQKTPQEVAVDYALTNGVAPSDDPHDQ